MFPLKRLLCFQDDQVQDFKKEDSVCKNLAEWLRHSKTYNMGYVLLPGTQL